MSTPDVAVHLTWRQLTGGTHEHLLDGLLSRLREPHRRYHTVTHVMWVLRHVDELLAEPVHAGIDGDAVRLAALYHDAVYDPRRSDNEAVSATLAAEVAATLGWHTSRCGSVHRLVMATAGHTPTSADEAVLVDADLAVLGGEPKDYTAYVNGVRAEYAHVPDDAWRAGRAEVLRRFLEMPRLFTTDTMFLRRERRARANLAAELASLRR